MAGLLWPTATAAMGHDAAQACFDRVAAIRQLGQRYGESRVGAGVNLRGQLIELFVSDTGTWTILVSRALNGLVCIVLAGENWRVPPPTTPGEGT